MQRRGVSDSAGFRLVFGAKVSGRRRRPQDAGDEAQESGAEPFDQGDEANAAKGS
jgi:hypothetical protein